MNKWLQLRLWFALAILTLLLGRSLGLTAGQEDDQDAKKQFETLKKKLPKLIAQVTKPLILFSRTGEPVLEMARRIGPREAKITLVFREGKKTELGSCFIFLRFFEGSWTTTSFDNKINGSSNLGVDSKKVIINNQLTTTAQSWLTHQVMRAIDKQKLK
jgi:hypothetical protein